MAEKTIKHASFWYVDKQDRSVTALRGETVDITNDEDVERGERLGAFATDDDMKPGTVFGDFLVARKAEEPAPEPVVTQPDAPAGKPGNNDSRDKWIAYGTSKGAPAEETKPTAEGGLSRDALRDKYGV